MNQVWDTMERTTNIMFNILDLPDGFPIGFTIDHSDEKHADEFMKYTYTDPEKGLILTVQVIEGQEKEKGLLKQIYEGTQESMYVRMLLRFVAEKLDIHRGVPIK